MTENQWVLLRLLGPYRVDVMTKLMAVAYKNSKEIPGTPKSGTIERKKTSYFPLYWLFNGTPYNGLLSSPHNRVSIIPYIP